MKCYSTLGVRFGLTCDTGSSSLETTKHWWKIGYFQNGASTVAEFLDHVENIGSVLIHPHFSMRGSWTNVNRNASPSLVAVETLSTSSPLVEAHPTSIQTVPQYTPVTAAHYSSPTPQLIDEESTSATNQDLYDYPIPRSPFLHCPIIVHTTLQVQLWPRIRRRVFIGQ